MECNKEEAIRAMEVAEKKMQKKDFVSARKMAGRAQHLYPDLMNISQMILVCDVHCAAESKVNGGESDWYGILQIEPTADEVAIKKQYRKFALSLHPDKNKFAGASDAFKLVGEAQKVLLDPEKRFLYDNKCKALGKYQASKLATHQGSRQTNVRGHPWFQNKFMNSSTSQFVNQQHRQQQQQQTQLDTFWTICPFCSVKYQYYKEVLNKTLSCQNCKKAFTGYEMNPPSGIPGSNSSQPTFPQQSGAFSKGNSTTVPQRTKNSSPKKAMQGSLNIKNVNRDSFAEKRFTATVGEESKLNKNHMKIDNMKGSKVTTKKRNKSAESTESCSSESSMESGADVNIEEDGGCLPGQNSGYHGDQNPRRSTRSKQRVSYDENLSGDDEANPSKKSKCGGSFNVGRKEVEDNSITKEAAFSADILEDKKEVKDKEVSPSDEVLQNGENDMENSSDPQLYEIPDPEFYDFDKDRKKECFAVGQMWAVYDTLDAMPRFYALVQNVQSPGFKLQITWLEPVPDSEDKIKWVNEGLPVSCGKFNYGNRENSADDSMFSHQVEWKKGSQMDTFEIYPRRGETWALFKNWDVNWHSDPHGKKGFEYEFVEVLSDYADNSGVCVAYLGKLKGFAFLFCRISRNGISSFLIPPKDIFRFSHKIPSFQMSGKKGKCVPQGSFELDPASLPASLDGIDVSQYFDTDGRQMHRNGSCSGSQEDILEPKERSSEHVSSSQFVGLKVEPKGNAAWAGVVDLIEESEENEASADKVELKAKAVGNSVLGQAEKEDFQNYSNGFDSSAKEIEDSPTSASEAYEIPEPEFYNFDAEKAEEKFQVGQIWALYGDEDALPKYYGRIKKIDLPPRFALHLTWLVPCSLSKDVIQWTDKKMPICCGNFKLGKGKPQMFTSTGPFSHQLRVVSKVEKNVYAVYPEKGDIWALYKHWRSEMTCSDLDNCQYDVVEVVERNEEVITVLALELVTGFKSVFKPQIAGQSTVTRQIPWAELLRFSHQIPSVRLTEERDGSLRGFWELDPAALPVYFFCPS